MALNVGKLHGLHECSQQIRMENELDQFFAPATPRSRSGSVLQIFTVVRVTVSSWRRLLCTRCT
uniref:AlNc14C362G11006 protein n=1 Tax=Albugo laibachii Nc14 TaxID=890382 RepID=F0WXS0_9STRA|nr:AlNc14C362G11006 [Albugo laibachii Nc14]|eukprot:CCA26267.1 AlNc14C362G11006 [Albugo laibachii Nc14]